MSRKKWVFLVAVSLGTMFLFGCGFMQFQKAGIMLTQERYEEAIPIYKDFLIEHPDFVDAKSRLGFAYLKTGRLDEAIAQFEAALALQPGDPYSVLYMGMAYLNKEEFGKAMEIWQGYRDSKRNLRPLKRITIQSRSVIIKTCRPITACVPSRKAWQQC
jgi:tetratricopeptide (TPR) repeat protein